MEAPPLAARRPVERRHHGDLFDDPYEWLRDGQDPEVLDHLVAENAWCEAQTAHLKPVVDELVGDVEIRTRETDLSVPQLVHHEVNGSRVSFWYYTRTVKGSQYPLMSRLPVAVAAPPDPWRGPEGEEVLLDGNVEAAGHAFFSLGTIRVSPDGRLLAYCVDFSGDERYTLHIRDLATGVGVDTPIEDTATHLAWAGSSHVFYTRHDDARRPFQLLRHRLGTDSARDPVVQTEEDEQFWLSVSESRDRRWILSTSGSSPTSETRLLSTAEPEGEFRVVAPRRSGVKYRVEVAGDRLLVLHNDGAEDFELAQAPLEATSPDQWRTVVPHTAGVRLVRADAYEKFVVVSLRRDAVTALHILPRTATGGFGSGADLQFEDPLHTVSASVGPNYQDTTFRMHDVSFIAPSAIRSYDIVSRALTVLKQEEVLEHPLHGPYDPARYVQRREWAVGEDGTRIPISVVTRRDSPQDGSAPLILQGYGAYETRLDPMFDGMWISLLDRGFVFAIAHVRGGGELGREWYHSGKGLNKINSFTDFVRCAEHLIEQGYTSAERLGAWGMSAGGLLVGAAANRRPDLFRAVNAAVPFVDPLTTVLDPDLPLTVTEWKEWGDPLHDPEAYAYIKSYAPYENIRSATYPSILATGALNDTRVSFAEPAKWVAELRMRAQNAPERPILLKTELEAGHGGATGRYDHWRDMAFQLAWLADQLVPAEDLPRSATDEKVDPHESAPEPARPVDAAAGG